MNEAKPKENQGGESEESVAQDREEYFKRLYKRGAALGVSESEVQGLAKSAKASKFISDFGITRDVSFRLKDHFVEIHTERLKSNNWEPNIMDVRIDGQRLKDRHAAQELCHKYEMFVQDIAEFNDESGGEMSRSQDELDQVAKDLLR